MSEARAYGIVAAFADPNDIVAAARRLQLNGFHRVEAYTPFPVEGLEEALRPGRPRLLPILMLIGGLVGAGLALFMQYWGAAVDYPINVGGRPYASWPAFIPTAWEFAALFAVASGFFGFLLFGRLPRLHHPLFASPLFDRVSRDRFVLCVEARDPRFEAERLRQLLGHYGAEAIDEVAA